MKLVAGKKYVQRNGVVLGPWLLDERSGMFKCKGVNFTHWRHPTGVANVMYVSHYDLVEEYVDKENWLKAGEYYLYTTTTQQRKAYCSFVQGDKAGMVVWRSEDPSDFFCCATDAKNLNGDYTPAPKPST